MGFPSMWLYGDADLGSAIETIETVVAKIKTNKFDKSDLVELHKATVELDKALTDEK